MNAKQSGTGDAGSGTAAGASRGRVVISSVTGKPIAWEEPEKADNRPGTRTPERRPILPDRVAEDAPEPGSDESNDARIAGDVPPHWGRGR